MKLRLTTCVILVIAIQIIFASEAASSPEMDLVEALKQGGPNARIAAMRILRERPQWPEAIVPLLAKALEDERWEEVEDRRVWRVADWAEWTLAAYGDAAVPTVEALLADPARPVCRRVANVLGSVALPKASTAAHLLNVIRNTESRETRIACVSAYGVVEPNNESLSENIHELLADTEDRDLYKLLIDIAGSRRIADKRVVRQIEAALVDRRDVNLPYYSSLAIRAAAASTLGRIGGASRAAELKLREMMDNDEDWDVKAAAAFAVFRVAMRDEKALEKLAEIAQHPDWDSTAAIYAVEFLGELGSGARPAATTLRHICTWHVDEHVGIWSNVRGPAYRALAQVEGADSISTLRLGLKSNSFFDRYGSAEAIGLLGRAGNAAVPDLIRCLSDDGTLGVMKDESRRAAARALGEIGPDAAEAIPVLEKLIQGDNSILLSRAATEALRKIKQIPGR